MSKCDEKEIAREFMRRVAVAVWKATTGEWKAAEDETVDEIAEDLGMTMSEAVEITQRRLAPN